jgi:hypothetical protein
MRSEILGESFDAFGVARRPTEMMLGTSVQGLLSASAISLLTNLAKNGCETATAEMPTAGCP